MSEENTENEEGTEVETVETVTEIDPAAAEALAKTIGESIKGDLITEMKSFLAEQTQEVTPVAKNVNAGREETDPDAIEQVNIVRSGNDITKMSKELRFAKQVQASLKGNTALLKELDEYHLDLRTKAGYQNETTNSEGGYLVLQPEFEAEIERLLPQYGAMAGEVQFVDLPGNSVITNRGLDNIAFGAVDEGGVKPARKSTFAQDQVPLYKYAAILLATTELLEDQAVDFWNDATNQFAYAYGKKIDEMVLTDAGPATYKKGILHTPGVVYEPISGPTGTTWDDLLNMKYRVPGEAAPGGIYVMHRSTLNGLRQLKDNQNQYLAMTAPFFTENGLVTPWGDRIVLTDAMPDTTQANWNGTGIGGGVVYGNFSRYAKVYRKAGGLQLDVSETATVVDSAGNTQNLWQNNLVGMKGEFRATAFFKFPGAFAVGAQTNVS